MVVEGKLLRIAHGCMGDAGHVIVSPEGPACTCGGRGCAEALLSTAALGEAICRAHVAEDAGFRSLVEDARAENPQPARCLKKQDTGSASPRLRSLASSCPTASPSPADFRKRVTPSFARRKHRFTLMGEDFLFLSLRSSAPAPASTPRCSAPLPDSSTRGCSNGSLASVTHEANATAWRKRQICRKTEFAPGLVI